MLGGGRCSKPLISASATIIAASPMLRFPITESENPGARTSAHGVPHVAEDEFPPSPRRGLANMLFDLFDASQLDEGRAPRLLRRHARADLRLGVLLDKGADLLAELAVSRAAVHRTAQRGPQSTPHPSHAPSRTFSTAVATDFQCCRSRASCFCPVFVIV